MAGMLYDGKAEPGMAHVFEHMVFRNLKSKYDTDIYELLVANKLSFNATTYNEFVQFEFSGHSDGFSFACQLIRQMFDDFSVSGEEYKAELESRKSAEEQTSMPVEERIAEVLEVLPADQREDVMFIVQQQEMIDVQKEYMNNPISGGAVFSEQWIRYKPMLKLKFYESIVVYVDASWKSSGKNDYKACKMWGRPRKGLKTAKPTELHCIRAFVRQCSVGEMVRWLYDLYEAIPEDAAATFYMEANFMQDTILDEFEREGVARGYQLPILPDTRKKPDKYARIEAISPLWERGCVYYNEKLQNDPDMKTGIEQTLAFEQGSRAHDDSPDADEGAIWKLQKQVREDNFQPRMGVRQLPDNAW
jgi:predicted phage terminase large subunit-like protein